MTYSAKLFSFAICVIFNLCIGYAWMAHAAPGAHGPDGEHLDNPVVGTSNTSKLQLQAKSELYELTAELKNRELIVLIDRYETNEPVLNAQLEVEVGSLNAKAVFQPERGDYILRDPKFIKILSNPGQHALVFSLIADNNADLLNGTLTIPAPKNEADK